MATQQDHAVEDSVYEFGAFCLNSAERTLLRDGVPVPLTEKTFLVLQVLVSRGGHLVERHELVQAVWKDTFIEEGNLTVTISMLRKALGDDRGANKFIETIAKRGYRFLPKVTCRREAGESSEVAVAPPPMVQVAPTPATATETAEASPAIVANVAPEVMVVAAKPVATVLSRRTLLRIAALVLAAVAIGFGVRALLRHVPHERVAAAAVAPLQRYVAVAPLTVTGAGSLDTHAGASVASNLVVRLSKRTGLMAQSVGDASAYPRSVSYKATDAEIDALLTGTINSSGQDLNVSMKLSTADGKTLWSSSFRGAPSAMQRLEDQIDTAVSRQMFALTPAAVTSRQSPDFQAQRLYLAGRYFWNERTEAALRRSIECYQQAIFRDPGFAEAYAGMADSYALLASYSVEPPFEAYPNAKTAAERALQLNADLAEGHTALGMVALYYEWNWAGAAQEFKRAIELSPTDAGSYVWDSLYFAAVGETSVALEQAEKARQMDPMSMPAIMHLGSAYYWDRQLGKAAEIFRSAIAQNANFARAHWALGVTQLAQKDFDGALREFHETERLSGPDPYLDSLIGCAEARRGNTDAAKKILDDLTARSEHEYVPAFSFGLLYIGLGDEDKAIDWMERARLDRSSYLIFAKVDPLLDPLRQNPRFNQLLSRMDLGTRDYTTTAMQPADAAPLAVEARQVQPAKPGHRR